MYETIQLKIIDTNLTKVSHLGLMEKKLLNENIYTVIDDYNKQGYYLTAVNGLEYFLTKRID